MFDKMSQKATVRNLKIKTSTCKHIVKELRYYDKEVEREAAKTAEMKEKAADTLNDLKQQENVLAESRMTIPDCRKRLEAALADLKVTLLITLCVCKCCSKHSESCWSVVGCSVSLYLHRSNIRAEFEEESDNNECPEIEDARSTVKEVEQLFQTTDT